MTTFIPHPVTGHPTDIEVLRRLWLTGSWIRAKVAKWEINPEDFTTSKPKKQPVEEKVEDQAIVDAIEETTEEAVEAEEVTTDDIVETMNTELEIAQSNYEAKFGKPVANRYKNDLDWILAQLND